MPSASHRPMTACKHRLLRANHELCGRGYSCLDGSAYGGGSWRTWAASNQAHHAALASGGSMARRPAGRSALSWPACGAQAKMPATTRGYAFRACDPETRRQGHFTSMARLARGCDWHRLLVAAWRAQNLSEMAIASDVRGALMSVACCIIERWRRWQRFERLRRIGLEARPVCAACWRNGRRLSGHACRWAGRPVGNEPW